MMMMMMMATKFVENYIELSRESTSDLSIFICNRKVPSTKTTSYIDNLTCDWQVLSPHRNILVISGILF